MFEQLSPLLPLFYFLGLLFLLGLIGVGIQEIGYRYGAFERPIQYNDGDILEEEKIVSIERNSDIKGSSSGSFVLGFGSFSGSIGQEMRYYYYTVFDDGDYKLDSISADNTYIRESKEYPALLRIYNSNGNNYFVLRVPFGTIKKEYKI
ncbi:MAG: hypothetical protein PHS92_02075 [Candidatus Gracilibacteria bacterium]|nr:hypothetical protein [Candidatus Gracilibacteria bacterium]